MISANNVLTNAMQLPLNERADLAHQLLLSLEPEIFDEAEVAAAWQSEIEGRLQKIADGTFKAHDWRGAIDEIRKGLKKETNP